MKAGESLALLALLGEIPSIRLAAAGLSEFSAGVDRASGSPRLLSAGGSLDWSPNGRWVLFQNHTGGVHLSTIWLMRPNGENRHPITTTAGGTVTWESGSFSPDGQRIVVVQGASISVLSKRGDILQTITASAVDGDPDWGSRPK